MSWIVRSDVGNKPAWLKREHIDGGRPLYDVTDNKDEAYVFSVYADAELAADIWSDVPGVWYATRSY